MHCNLLTFGLLPLPMCRTVLKLLSSSDTLSALFHVEHAQWTHRMLGFLLMGGVLLGGVLWWFCLGPTCVDDADQRSCKAFHPDGAYYDIYNNLAAVLFLRELVITSFIAIFSTALLVFPLGAGAKPLPVTTRCARWVHRNAFEIFYFTHVIFAAV